MADPGVRTEAVFKTTAIDHSAIPPHRSGQNPRVSARLEPESSASVTVSVTIATTPDDTRCARDSIGA
jgi:hypothetical protein